MSEPPVVITDGDWFSVTEGEGHSLLEGTSLQRHHPHPPPAKLPLVVPRKTSYDVPQWRHPRRVR